MFWKGHGPIPIKNRFLKWALGIDWEEMGDGTPANGAKERYQGVHSFKDTKAQFTIRGGQFAQQGCKEQKKRVHLPANGVEGGCQWACSLQADSAMRGTNAKQFVAESPRGHLPANSVKGGC
eukprot:1160465-Pelagomonas_calceolata.AAC.3